MPFSDEELTLIGAIHADPRNDAPRLAYADWLAMNDGAEYAEFIRLQCQMPYVTIATRGKPHVSFNYDISWSDRLLDERLERILSLYPLLLKSARFSLFRHPYYYQEFRRGLALWEVSSFDVNQVSGIVEAVAGSRVVSPIPPLVRLRLILHTPAMKLVSWLRSATMQRADDLIVRVERSSDALSEEFWLELSALDSECFRSLDRITLYDVPNDISGSIAGKARKEGVIELEGG